MHHPNRPWALMALLPLLAIAPCASAVDTYLGAGALQVPALGIGSATFFNVTLTVNLPLVHGPSGSVAVGTQDSYDPATNQLFIPAVVVGSETYYNVVVTVSHLTSIGSVSGADTFDGSTLVVRNVQAILGTQAGNSFHDVSLQVGLTNVLSVGGGLPRVPVDQYVIDPATGAGVLTIGAVEVGPRVYTNVVVKPPREAVTIAGFQESVLYAFQGGTDGSDPEAGLVMDASGNLFGTTRGDGVAGDYGTVYRLTPAAGGGYTETVLYRFSGGADSDYPLGMLTLDASGNLYGTAAGGRVAGDFGNVFRLTPDGSGAYTSTVLYRFQGGADGSAPFGKLLIDASGNLYGTTSGGDVATDYGTVFRLTPNGDGSYAESVIHAFQGGADGADSESDLIMDATGNLYGTTYGGDVTTDYGTVFRLTADGTGHYTETVIHRFQGGADGANPQAGLILDANGNLYGATSGGDVASDDGTVFRLAPDGSGGYAMSVLYPFMGGADGGYPVGGLVMDASGALYGTASGGGDAAGNGTVFKLTPGAGGAYGLTVLHPFAGGSDGTASYSTLIRDASGNLYGTTTSGGTAGYGTVFAIH